MRAQCRLILAIAALYLASIANASLGDRLPEFKECVELCTQSLCVDDPVPIPLHRRLLLWSCPSECDYTCQHVITDIRLTRPHPYLHPVYQFHGKWPFHRFLGLQEPFSVLFSLFNFLAHLWGLAQIRQHITPGYSLRRYYVLFGYVGLVSWTASMVFHTRDFTVTERADYFAAGANVLYGFYLAPVRIFRLDQPTRQSASLLRFWTTFCISLYIAHTSYLTFWRWNYTYNMGANIAIGIVTNVLWVTFSWTRWRKSKRTWKLWPAMIVVWIVLAMSLELLEFVPWELMVDAHSLWHLGTVVPTIWWYIFLIKDAEDDIQDARFKM